MSLDIITIPTPSLRKMSKLLTRELLLLGATQQLIDNMIPIMYKDGGIGLAAPQVGQNIRICIIGKEADESLTEDVVLVNPSWEKLNKKTSIEIEGCLSVPNTYGKVKRYKHIKVQAMDRHGKIVSFEANNFFARVIQHEVDHLDGVLFIDKAKDIYTVEDKEKNPRLSV